MKYREWKLWVDSLPWSLRWFVFVVLFRSILDVFAYLKHVSPFLSPLYIVGVLTPVLILVSLLSKTLPRKKASTLDFVFGIWSALLLFNALAAIIEEISFGTLEIVFKLTMPIFIYFFLRRLIRSKRDLIGIAMTFLYSSIFPFAMILYGELISPVGTQITTRGYTRYSGSYRDVMDYAIYVIGAFLVVCFIFLNKDSSMTYKKRAWILIGGTALSILALIHAHLAASWGIFIAILALLVLYSSDRTHISALVFVLFAGGIGYFFVGDAITDRVSALYQTDLRVIAGETDSDYAFHGRMWRWRLYIAIWNEMSPFAKWIGISVESTPSGDMGDIVLAGIHNDYLRIMFASGLIGLFVYLIFYLRIFVRSLRMPRSEKFLVQGAVVIMLLYSVSTTPTLYAPLLYLCLSVFAYAALPRAAGNRYEQVGNPSTFPRVIERV